MPQIEYENDSSDTMTGDDAGQSVTVRPGGKYIFSSACSLIKFMNAGPYAVVDNAEGEYATALQKAADSEGCTERLGTVVVPTNTSPASDTVGPGGDSPQDQGAPRGQAPAQVTVKNGPYGEAGDTRQPTEAMHDRANPQSGDQIRDGERSRGATDQEADDAAARAAKGDPPPGEQRSTHTGDQTSASSRGGDPVDLFSGKLSLTGVDLDVTAPYIAIQLQRVYLSGRPYWGPFGFNWDHNWNVYLRELNDGRVARWNGKLHEDVFAPANGGMEPPRGVFELLEAMPAPQTGYRIRVPGGMEMRFDQPPGWSDGERIPLILVTNRAGHAVELTYDAQNRLDRVRDEDGRGLQFRYGDCGLLETVEDHAGRVVTYWHDDQAEHLIAVQLPATADFPQGRITNYRYDPAPSHPAMLHNVVGIVDNDRNTVLANTYGADPASFEFNRVVRQLQGGYLYAYQYEQIQWVAADPAFADVVAVQTCAHLPDGGMWVYSFNYAGELLDERVRLKRERSFRVAATQRTYDTQGNLVTLTEPDGGQTAWTYDDGNADPRNRGNLLRVERRAPPIFPEPSRVVLRAQYEPLYQLIRQQVVENGALTTLTYDFDAAAPVTNRGDLLRIDWPDATLPDGSIQSASTRYEYDAEARLTATITPDGLRDELVYQLAAGAGRGFLIEYHADAPGANERTLLGYDVYGFPASRTDPGGAVTLLRHNQLGDLEEQILPAVNGVIDRIVYRYNTQLAVSATERPRGQYQDGMITDPFILDRVTTNPLGQITEVVLAANTADPRRTKMRPDFRGDSVQSTDAGGLVTRDLYDERGLLLRRTLAAGTPDEATTVYSYDLAGRLLTAEAPGGRTTRYEYDAWGRQHRVTLPSGTQVLSAYGMLDQPVQRDVIGVPDAGGPARVLARVHWEYDERARLIRTVLDSFESDPALAVPVAEVKWHDRDGRCVKRVAPRNAVWGYDYDGRGRQVRERDPYGNTVETKYGVDGLPSRLTYTDVGPWGNAVRFEDYGHDSRKRLTTVTTSAGAQTVTVYDGRDLAVERQHPNTTFQYRYSSVRELVGTLQDPGGLALLTAYQYDPLGRGTGYTDPAGEATLTSRDALGRPRRITLADGSIYAYDYDSAGDLVSIASPDGSSIVLTYDTGGRMSAFRTVAGAGRTAVPDHRFAYNGLDQVVRAETAAGAVVKRYDSLSRVLQESAPGGTFAKRYDDVAGRYDLTFPNGRIERHSLDLLGRVDRVELAARGGPPLGAVGGAPGDQLLKVEYLGGSRVGRLSYTNGVVSEWHHDEEGRLVRVEHLSPTNQALDTIRYRYDASGRRRLKQLDIQPAENDLYLYDTRERLVEVRSQFPLGGMADPAAQANQDADIAAAEGAAVAAGFVERYGLDSADTRTQVTTTAGAGPIVTPYVQNAGHKVVSVGAGALTYDADGNRTGDARRSVQYDALGRPVAIRNPAGNLITRLEYDPAGRVSSIQTAAGTRRRLWLEGLCLQETTPGGALIAQRTHHPMLLLPSIEVRAGGLYSLHPDGHESLLLVANRNGAPAERYRYAAFGQASVYNGAGAARANSAIGLNPVFAGMELVRGSDLYLTPRRLFDPDTGLFLARDPYLHLQSPSPYLFALHNPIIGLDPSGEFAPLVAGLVVGAIGGIAGAAVVMYRGGNYDWKDVAAAAAIGFGAGFITGVTFGAASTWAAGLLLPAAGGAAAAATGGAAAGGLGVSLASGAFGGLASGAAGGVFSGAANASYRYARHGGDYWNMVGEGVVVEGLSGAAAGLVGGVLFQGLSRVGVVPQAAWASLRRGASVPVMSATIGRGLLSPYGLGAPATGFASGWSGGVVRHMLEGESFEDSSTNALGDGEIGALTGSIGWAHPTTWRYWGARLSPEIASSVQSARAGSAHHQRNVAQYPEFATSRPNTNSVGAFWRWYGNNIIRGNIEGPFSEYDDPASPFTHNQLHGLWRFGQSGNFSNWASHGPWTPAWNVNHLPEDPRAQNHDPKPEGSRASTSESG